MTLRQLRQQVCEANLAMGRSGLVTGTFGNVSGADRERGAVAIKPSGVPYDEMAPGDIARMPIGGEYGSWTGPMQPSSEWRFHLDIMRARPEVGSVVHTHSTYATTLAICGREIPAIHYMIAAARA